MSKYVMDGQDRREPRRLELLEEWADKGTMRVIEDLGISPGWRCLEVGAGGGSIARWLSKRVGTQGEILATDLDVRMLEREVLPNFVIRQHDIVHDSLPEGVYDLVHARLVLEHLKDRESALKKMAHALKPGGWLVLEDQDIAAVSVACDTSSNTKSAFMDRTSALVRLLTMAGVDLDYGRHLHRDLLLHGMTQVGAEGRISMVVGGSNLAEFWQLTWQQLRPQLAGFNLLNDVEIDEMLALFDDPTFVWTAPTIMAAWGRRPVPS